MHENQVVKYQLRPGIDAFLFAMFLMYCRAPGRETAPGEPVDLGEIGAVAGKTWSKMTPYSPAIPKKR